MKISVMVTTYNHPRRLVKVLKGLRFQTIHPEEVVVADDGSGPDTAAALDDFCKNRIPFALHHVRHEDRGFRAAAIRNKAILKSTGHYLICLDGDCIPDRHFIGDHKALARAGHFFQGKRVLVDQKRSPDFTHNHSASFKNKFNLLFSKGISNRHHLIRMPLFPVAESRRLSGIKTCNMGFFRNDILHIKIFVRDISPNLFSYFQVHKFRKSFRKPVSNRF